jgi:hypothetical protein
MKRTLTVALVSLLVTAVARAEEIAKLKTFYFGNSFLENTMVGFHPVLGKSASKTWEVDALIHPGVPIWVHAVRQTEPESRNYIKFHEEGPDTDAIVMLQFAGQGLKYVAPEMWGKMTFDPPRDVGDLASCIALINTFLEMNPKGWAYVYTAWPNGDELREFRDRVKKEVELSLRERDEDRGKLMKKVVTAAVKERMSEEVEPVLEQTDFEALWLAEDYVADCTPYEVRRRFGKYAGCIGRNSRDEAWKPTLEALAEAAETTPDQVKEDLAMVGLTIEKLRTVDDPKEEIRQFCGGWPHTHSRPHNYALLEGLKKEFPGLWKENRLGMIPVGDVMLALHKKIREGAMPPLKSVSQFSEGHMRSGLPRYMLGATFYAVLFRDHPKNLSADIYAKRDNYIKDMNGLNKPAGGFYVHVPDLGRHIEITPERKRIMDDTIWEVVKGHPYTGVR